MPDVAREIRSALRERHFKEVFFDTRSLEGGELWPTAIRRALARSDVLFVIIGPQWEPDRLADAADFVRAELLAARRNKSIVTPLLVGIEQMPTLDDVPAALRFLPDLQSGGKLPNDPSDENLWRLAVSAAGPPAMRARRRKWVARMGLVGALSVISSAIWFVQRVPETCGTDDLDVGVAVRLEDRRSPSQPGELPSTSAIADSIADMLRTELQTSPGINVTGPAGCGPLERFGAPDGSEDLASKAQLDVVVVAELVAADQESQLQLSMAFEDDALPDAPEVSGTHFISETPGGKNISPGVVAERLSAELGHVASVLDGFQLYASGNHTEAAEKFADLSTELSGLADPSLLRVTELLHANSVLLQARGVQATDPDVAKTLYDTALAIYTSVSDLDGTPYGRAHLGIGEVWVERCRHELAQGSNGSPTDSPDPVVAGLLAFDKAEQAAVFDPATEIEVGLKSSLGRGNLALCGTLLSSDGARRVDLAGQAEVSLQAVIDDALTAARFDNLASEANVGLAIVDVVRCDRTAPETAIEVAGEHLETSLQHAPPSRLPDINDAIAVLDGALEDGAVRPSDGGPLSSSLGTLLAAACDLPVG